MLSNRARYGERPVALQRATAAYATASPRPDCLAPGSREQERKPEQVVETCIRTRWEGAFDSIWSPLEKSIEREEARGRTERT